MSNLRPQVRSAIRSFIQSQEGYHIASDILRVIEEEASLMKETQDLHDMFDNDPMEQFQEIGRQVEQLKRVSQVTSCSRIRAGSEYGRIHAVVTLQKCQNMQLTFTYERKPRAGGAKGCHVNYSIELSHNFGQREILLNVQVWAPTGVPSEKGAVCVQEAFMAAQEDEWEDIDDEEDVEEAQQPESPTVISDGSHAENSEGPLQANKKQKTGNGLADEQDSGKVEGKESTEDSKCSEEEEEKRDSFIAFLDPDLLENFLESAGLMPMNEGTAFFLLMTFPYYEHEWDLVGYVLDKVFGAGSDEEDEGDTSDS